MIFDKVSVATSQQSKQENVFKESVKAPALFRANTEDHTNGIDEVLRQRRMQPVSAAGH